VQQAAVVSEPANAALWLAGLAGIGLLAQAVWPQQPG
jgi:2-keto-4-pentenoate hydratase